MRLCACPVRLPLPNAHTPPAYPPMINLPPQASEQLACALEHLKNPSRHITYIYDKPKGLNSDVFNLHSSIADKIKYSIWGTAP